MDVQKYLERIGFVHDGKIEMSLETLTKLQECHQQNVPWENLDTMTGVTFDLKYENLYDKIVTRNRGGWCHELNGLFCWGLRELGFKVTMLNSRCWNGGTGLLCREFDHMVPMVTLENGEEYLMEVGFGSSTAPFWPIKLQHGGTCVQPANHFKTTKEGENEWVLWCQGSDKNLHKQDDWDRVFKFYKVNHDIEEFEETCGIYQRKEDEASYFMTVNPIIMLKTNFGKGVKLLVQTKYREYLGLGSKSTRKTIKKEDKLDKKGMERILRDEFNMNVDLSGMNMKEVVRQADAASTDSRKLE